MSLSPGYIDFVLELLTDFGPVHVKRMFGGAVITCDGVGFAVLDDDTFYVKADPEFAVELKERGSRPWSYSVRKDGTVRDIGYWSLPDTAADDPDETVQLARRSFDVALRAAAEKAAKKPRKSPAPRKAPPSRRPRA
ncbi:MAG: competence protein TfoX [Alphaproteobacteria bacterium]|nr:competence protein TfoX [Alphaproteobacteria bacterium]